MFAASSDAKLLFGIELSSFVYISFILGVAALKVNLEFVAILWALVPGFGLATVTNVGSPAVIGHIGGYCLILSAILGFYGASALVVNRTHQRTLLPLLSRS